MHRTFTALIEAMGGTPTGPDFPERGAKAVSVGGEIIHEAGTVRMGADPKTSVLNQWSQAHEVKNLFVADAAPFDGNPDQNVTLTIVANAWRAAEHLADEMKKGNV
jgi:choline dehydrogenase-like flavoprotein